LVWKGDGYDFNYFPKNKSNEKRVGMLMSNTKLKNFIKNEINLETCFLWDIPLKNHIRKQIEEINRCKYIITDDFYAMNLATFLKKEIFFLNTMSYNFRLETFGYAKIFKVPYNLLQLL
jgi:hypothetical protein